MPLHSLCALPDDPLLDGIFRYLEPRQLVRLRLTCTRLYALTHLRSVWHNALEKLRRERNLPLPYPSRPLPTLTSRQLEDTVVKMVRLDNSFTKSRVKPALIRTFNTQGGQVPKISCMHLLAGGEWLLTANTEEVTCWDLTSPDPCSAGVYKLAPVSVSGKDQGYKDICVRNLQAQLHASGDEAVVAAYMSYDGHLSNVWNDKVAVWKITGLSRRAEITSTFITSLCFPDYAPEYGMSDLNGDYVAFLGREHETPVISITNWRTGDADEYEQAKFRPDFSPVISETDPLRVQGITLVPPYVLVVAGPVIALFPIPSFERVKHLCGDAPRLPAQQIHRFDTRAYTLMGEYVGVAQNPALTLTPQSLVAASPQPITLLTSRSRITLTPATEPGKEALYVLPPTVSRLRAWTHRTSKPAAVGPSGTRGVWIQRPTGIRHRLIAWTAARHTFEEEEQEDKNTETTAEALNRIEQIEAAAAGPEAESTVMESVRWPRNGADGGMVLQGWNSLPHGRARKVDLYPVKVEDVKRVAFDEGTGRTCLGMRNGEVHVLDFA
ncbi:hypothetical protein K439DRAFT_1658430 [Ramaria rubella]|nr:hypothetical protein K439DRAFT_1658430 [Ramaria rubella]